MIHIKFETMRSKILHYLPHPGNKINGGNNTCNLNHIFFFLGTRIQMQTHTYFLLWLRWIYLETYREVHLIVQ